MLVKVYVRWCAWSWCCVDNTDPGWKWEIANKDGQERVHFCIKLDQNWHVLARLGDVAT